MTEYPKVSCILPACYGELALVAVNCFLDQDYQGELELIILDNNDDNETIAEKIPVDSRIRYCQVPRQPVGALRNLGSTYATGEICISWDADDWYGPSRVTDQVKRLQESGKSVTGWHSIYYYDISNGNTYKYMYEPSGNHPPYACGTSQAYRKSWWENHPFPTSGVEDWTFAQMALHAKQLDSCCAGQLCVARAHSASICFPTQLGRHKQYPAVPQSALPDKFYSDISRPFTPPAITIVEAPAKAQRKPKTKEVGE